MSAYQVAVVADETTPAAGTAVVRIAGLKAWPENATLRILPIDDASVPPKSDGWPWEAIRPLRVELTDAGVDVVLGPEVVNSARLLPGTPITIKVGAANLEVEARWPSVAPAARRRTGAVAMSATQLLTAKAEREMAEKMSAARRQEAAELAVKSARDAASEAEQSGKPARAPAAALRETGQLARLLPIRRPEGPPSDRHPSPPANAETEFGASSLGQLAKLGAPSVSNVVTMPQVPKAKASRRAWGLRGFAAGLATMAATLVGVAMIAPPSWLPPKFFGAQAMSVGTAQIGVLDLQSIFKDMTTAGSQSPRHKSAVNVDAATALSLADHSLRGQRTEAETEEAEFWLKRALANSFGGPDVGWALTQLGTIYATAGTPHHSYVKAHTVWELAAAQGDPVAHCFLGALYEHGLGVAKNRKTARDHYVTADGLGACRSAKEAAARLSE